MKIQLNTDANSVCHESLSIQVTKTVENVLKRFSDQITRVEVQLSNEISDKKSGNENIRCVLEARLEGRKPIAVTHHAATVDQAVDGAADKLHRLIDSTLGRLHDHHSHSPDLPPLEATKD